MKGQDIWLIFDERVTDIILGMDILKQVIMITNPYEEKAQFCKDQKDFDDNFELLVGQGADSLGTKLNRYNKKLM